MSDFRRSESGDNRMKIAKALRVIRNAIVTDEIQGRKFSSRDLNELLIFVRQQEQVIFELKSQERIK
jgi:hypothetical protein